MTRRRSRRALVLQHARTGPPALLGDWLRARGIEVELHDSSTGAPLPALDGVDFVASLGAAASPRDVHLPAVAAELDYLRAAVDADVPVLGLCYGGQALAAALGATITTSPGPELGWITIDSSDPAAIPTGPWLAWHYDVFGVPDGAELLARNAHSPQVFAHGPHLGVQFHPESTPDVVRVWAHKDAARIAGLGHDDPDALLAGGDPEAAARNAFVLFDTFLTRADIETGSLTR